MTLSRKTLPLLAAAFAVVLSACGQSGHTSSTAAASMNPLADTVASGTEAAGTMMCVPSADQVAACGGLAAGAACTLTAPDGVTTREGTCRASLDGTSVACAPNPPAPPQALVDACASKAAGDACSVTEADGEVRNGACVTARDGSTLVCGRVHTPPQAAVDACASRAAGDACTMTGRDGASTVAGLCSLGPASTGVLACAPAHELRPGAATACAGLAAGAVCAIGMGRAPVTGTCVVPAAGGDAICQPACGAVGGPFQCGPGAGHGMGPGAGGGTGTGGGMGPGPGPVTPPTPPQAALDACASLAAGATCSFTGLDGTTSVSGVCRARLDGTGALACVPAMPMPMPMPRH